MTFLTGKEYPELCETCRHMIDVAVDLVIEGPDTDDEEAPINFVYDHHLFCGGDHCAVEEQSRLDALHQVSGSVDDLTAARADSTRRTMPIALSIMSRNPSRTPSTTDA